MKLTSFDKIGYRLTLFSR